jgi:hypothetical protein
VLATLSAAGDIEQRGGFAPLARAGAWHIAAPAWALLRACWKSKRALQTRRMKGAAAARCPLSALRLTLRRDGKRQRRAVSTAWRRGTQLACLSATSVPAFALLKAAAARRQGGRHACLAA